MTLLTKHKLDLIEIITGQDGQFNDELQAYVTAYPINDGNEIIVEVEYVDVENDFEVIETVSHSVFLSRDE